MMENPLKPTGCTKRITDGESPHASHELGKSTVEECHANNDVWNSNVARMCVEKREDKHRRRKSEHATAVIHGGLISFKTVSRRRLRTGE